MEDLLIESNSDPEYLPYFLDSVRARNDSTCSRHPGQVLRVVTPIQFTQDSGVVGRAFNPCPPYEKLQRFTWFSYPTWDVLYEMPAGFTICDSRIFRDSFTGLTTLVGVGLEGDSILLYKAVPLNGAFTYDRLCISADVESQPNRLIAPDMWICGLSDLQSATKVFVNVDCPDSHRRLYCVDIASMMLEWTLPLASPLHRGPVYIVQDADDTLIVFTTLVNPDNGIRDDEFDDRYMYFVVLDGNGIILRKRILAANWQQISFMCAAETYGQFYVAHSLDFIESVDSLALDVREHQLSKVTALGTKLASITMPGKPVWVDVIPYGDDQSAHVWVYFREGRLAIYDTALSLIALCENTEIGFFHGRLKIPGESDSVYVFSDGLYDRTLSQILRFPFSTSSIETVAYDSSGNSLDILINGRNRFYIGRITEKSYLDLASVFYHRNQKPFIGGLLILLAGLLIVSFGRWKAKRKLEILRLEQAALIANEKYQQAKDIAGGFAHEIRNALFPADGLLTKLRRTADSASAEQDKIRKYYKDAHASIARAIGITELISLYTKLDSEYFPESTDLVSVIRACVDENRARIDYQAVAVSLPQPREAFVAINGRHAAIVVNNLLLNSLDALRASAEGAINIDITPADGTVRLHWDDNGEGMPADRLPRIFDTFYSTKPDTGLGLGLSIVRRIVELYGGSISVTSTVGSGTRFTLQWPQYKSKAK